MSRAANGVSRRHGEVARGMWAPLWPERAADEVPIGHVTNGVHVPTWIGAPMRDCSTAISATAGWSAPPTRATWEGVERIPDAELWEARSRQRAEMVEFIRRRSTQDRLLRGDLREYVGAAARAFDDHVLTIGFARRVATYKRLELLTRDPEWTLSLLGGERPVQVVLAGKAHPRDEEAKHSLQHLFGLKAAPVVGQRVVFLDDYDLATAAMLVRGCDVWLNVPRPPLEASGTSGMKSVFNGGLQLSVLDGWWAEAYDGRQRLGAPGRDRRTTPAPRTSATRRCCTACSTTRSCRRSTSATSAGCRPAWLRPDARLAQDPWAALLRDADARRVRERALSRARPGVGERPRL